MLGVSSKVIHHALNNGKSFLSNVEQVYDVARISRMILIGQLWLVPTWEGRLMLSSFAHISPKGIGKGGSCS
jgi:hypothetical protein